MDEITGRSIIGCGQVGDRFTVRCPYNGAFIDRARQLGGRFTDWVWTFSMDEADLARQAVVDIFADDGTGPTVTAEINFARGGSVLRGTVYAGPLPIARATGRDSGASFEPGVIVVTGGAASGGSYKNWETIIEAGTVLRIKNVPAALAERRRWRVI